MAHHAFAGRHAASAGRLRRGKHLLAASMDMLLSWRTVGNTAGRITGKMVANTPSKKTIRTATLSLLCLFSAFSGGTLSADAPAAAETTARPETAAPRSIADVVKILDHYKPDPAAAAKSQPKEGNVLTRNTK